MNKAILILIILSLLIGSSPYVFAMERQPVAQPERSEAWSRAALLFARLQKLGGTEAARKAASAAALQAKATQLAQAQQQVEAKDVNQANGDQSEAKKEDEKQN